MTGNSIFGFSEFVTALALLFIIYTITDVRFKFRLSTSPLPVWTITKYATAFIALGTLVSDLWFQKSLPIPDFLSNQIIWQCTFGAVFLFIVLLWLYFAYIKPSVYNRFNYKKYANRLYQIVLKGDEAELPIIAHELLYSAKNIIRYYGDYDVKKSKKVKKEKKPKKNKEREISGYAQDILLLMGNRKLCRYIISSSPLTAIIFFEEMIKSKIRWFPVKQFSQNITIEALNNEDSTIYHEDDGNSSGLIGYLRPFSKTIYGNFDLIDDLAENNGSPLDLSYSIVRTWDAKKLKAYTRLSLIFINSYFEEIRAKGRYFKSRAFGEILENIKYASSDIYKLNNSSNLYDSDELKRLGIAADFIREMIRLLEEKPMPKCRLTKKTSVNSFYDKNLYDDICELMLDIITSAASYQGDSDKCWTVHYNTVWSDFFSFGTDSLPQKIIHFRLRRLLFDNSVADKFFNYKSAKTLGICLNVMGLELYQYDKNNSFAKEYYALHKAILSWTGKNYLKIREDLPEVAKACLLGSITYDEQNLRLVKTYVLGLRKEAPKQYLQVQNSSSSPAASQGGGVGQKAEFRWY